jgi:DNA-binding protein HU-beta
MDMTMPIVSIFRIHRKRDETRAFSTFSASCSRRRRFRSQLCNQPQNLLEHLPGDGDLGHLGGNAAAVAEDLGPDLD